MSLFTGLPERAESTPLTAISAQTDSQASAVRDTVTFAWVIVIMIQQATMTTGNYLPPSGIERQYQPGMIFWLTLFIFWMKQLKCGKGYCLVPALRCCDHEEKNKN